MTADGERVLRGAWTETSLHRQGWVVVRTSSRN